MKWNFYFYFQMKECFYRKLRNHLAETNSWSSSLGNRTASFLWTSQQFQTVGERTTNNKTRSFYRSHISWNQPLELFSKGKSNHCTATCQERPALGLFGGEGARTVLRPYQQTTGRSCQLQFQKPNAAVSTCWTKSYRVFFLVQITNHWVEISEI